MFEEGTRALTQPAVHQKPVPWTSEAPLYNCLPATSAGLFIFRARKEQWCGWEREVRGACAEISTPTILNLIVM